MVDPLTLSAITLVVVSASSFFHLLGPACDWWRIRFKTFCLINYEQNSFEYAALDALLTHPAFVQSSHVTRRERRQVDAQWAIMQVATFDCIVTGKRMRIAYGQDEQRRPCIHMFCFWRSEMRYFEHMVRNGGAVPEQLVLVGCSGK